MAVPKTGAAAKGGKPKGTATTPAPGASAAAAPGSPERRALELFEESARAYREGRFAEAAQLLVEARTLAREPVLLYNLARAYEALGDREKAAEAYARYLEEEPAASDRGAIEGRVATLRRELEERDALRKAQEAAAAPPPPPPKAAPPPPEPPAPPPPPEGPGAAPWILAGAGIAAVSAGIVLGAVALGREGDARDEPEQLRAKDTHDDAARFATVANVTIGVGAALVVSGGMWLLFASPSRAAAQSGALSVPRAFFGPTGFVVRGTF